MAQSGDLSGHSADEDHPRQNGGFLVEEIELAIIFGGRKWIDGVAYLSEVVRFKIPRQTVGLGNVSRNFVTNGIFW